MNLTSWKSFHCLVISSGILAFHLSGSLFPLISFAVISIGWLWISQWPAISMQKPAGGYANLVTLTRFVLIIIISSFSGALDPKTTGMLFIVPLAMDALDGYIARRTKMESRFGALFDMETDALFVALTGMILIDRQLAGAWLFPAIYMRYFYFLLMMLMRSNKKEEKRTRFGPAIAVCMFVALVADFILPQFIGIPLLFMASILVILSFGYSFLQMNEWIR